MDWKPVPRFYAAARFAKPMPKRVGYPEEEFLPEVVDEFHAVPRSTVTGIRRPLTKINVDDRVKAACGTLVEVQYPIAFNPDEEGACPKCARKVRQDERERRNRMPVKYRTETPD